MKYMNKTEIQKDITKRIFSEELKPGDSLSEREFCETYNTSRTPMREILWALVAKGLLIQQRGKGFSVRTLDWKQLFEIFETREALEGMAARRCCEKLTRTGRERFTALKKKLESLDAENVGEEGVRLGRILHRMIIDEADNSLLEELYEKVGNLITLTTILTKKTGRIEARSRVAHIRIIETILTGRVDEAEMQMREHIQFTCNQLVDLLYSGRRSGASQAETEDIEGRRIAARKR
jgi:DNA-binding GntR family transcriptional regulator